jgi:rhamnogalacturonyl hydrolase YesR
MESNFKKASSINGRISDSLNRVQRWVEEHNFHGYEPSDGNLSFFHALTFNNSLLERVLQQVIWKSPFDIRRLAGVPMHQSTKGMGYMAAGYTQLYQLTKRHEYQERAKECFSWLIKNRAPMYEHFCWGDSFPFSSRGGRRAKYEPTIVWSSLIGQVFLDGAVVLGEAEYRSVAGSICEWIKRLPRNETSTGLCLGYTALGLSTIHNSNMLGAALLARFGQLTGDSEATRLACAAMQYSCERQREDGSWPYGDAAKYTWIDSFHTGYNLDSLRCYIQATGESKYRVQLERGYAFFKRNFFDSECRPKYYHNSTYPIDIQCAAQAIETLLLFSDKDPDALSMASRVATWTIENMQDPDGHFYYRDLGWKKIRTPMFHWGQATMFKALAVLLSATEKDPAT